MDYTNEDVFVYQIMDILVSQYDYKIVNVPRSKKDIWLAKEGSKEFPMIRLNAESTTSAIFEREYLDKIKQALTFVLQNESPLLIINTNANSKPFVEEGLVQMVVNHEMVSDAHLFEVFPALRGALHTVDNNQSECARLTRHLESVQIQKQRKARKFSWKAVPKASFVIGLIAVVAYILFELLRRRTGDYLSVAPYIVSGAYYKPMVYYLQEYWRFITTGFVHLDFILLLFYLLILYQMGRICEPIYGKLKYAIIFFLSLFIGNVFPYILDSNGVSMGMGPGIFGLLGALLLHAWQSKSYKNPVIRMQMNQIVMICIISMMYSGVSVYALLGGLIVGFFLSVLLSPNPRLKLYRKHFIICGVLIIAMMGYGVFNVKGSYPQLKEVDEAIVENYKTLGLESYANTIETALEKGYEE